VQFVDAKNGFAVGLNGRILATSDGGATWQKRDSGVNDALESVQFVDAKNGWAVGSNGRILATSDGGATWQKRDSGVSELLQRVYFADAKNGFAVGSNGTILRLLALDTSKITADRSDMENALKSIGIDGRRIGQPLIDFDSTEADAADQSKRASDDDAALATYEPKAKPDATAAGLLNNPMFLSNLNRVGITIYAFFAVTIVVAVYRYSARLGAHYDACADALELSNGAIDPRFHQLIRALSPVGIDFGKTPRTPVDQATELLKTALRTRGGD
jgi:hypothetical protein